MGRPIGSNFSNDFPYALLSVGGTGIITWTNNRLIPGNATYDNDIYMRRLDSLDLKNYLPFKKLLSFKNQPFFTSPAVFTGSTGVYSPLEAVGFDVTNKAITSTVMEILDNYNIGYMQAQVYDHIGIIRTYNGKPYLNRNFSISPANNPNGSATIMVRLFFTQQQFDDLRAADPTITSPASLAIIKQPGTSIVSAYDPVAGEIIIQPTAWKAVDGGYYLEFPVTSFSNFFIFKTTAALPVTWVNVSATWLNNDHATITWKVGDQKNVSSYFVQQSTDGMCFINVCEVPANSSTTYQCTVPAAKATINYYRVMEKDLDGQITFSKVVLLKALTNSDQIKIYPNPAQEYVTINSNGYSEGPSQLVLTNTAGAIVWQMNSTVLPSTGLRVSVKNLSNGIYFMHIKGIKNKQTIKLIKQ
jgi:Secretion system C-terminal sorting domain